MANPIALKYLFTVEYLNGETFKQGADDVSTQDPKRSAFYDVRLDEVKRFSISDGVDTYVVDLTDGHFEVNGKKFWLHDSLVQKYRLIFFRRRKQVLEQVVRTADKSIVGQRELDSAVIYRIGWQGLAQSRNAAGKLETINEQHVLQIF